MKPERRAVGAATGVSYRLGNARRSTGVRVRVPDRPNESPLSAIARVCFRDVSDFVQCGYLSRRSRDDAAGGWSTAYRQVQRIDRVRSPVLTSQPVYRHCSLIVIVTRRRVPGLCLAGRDVSLLNRTTTLSGGSLGSCVDEERSQLRELM